MTKSAFEAIKAGLEDALAYSEGDTSRGTTIKVSIPDAVDVAAIRKKLKLSQNKFAARFGFSASVVKDWEQGRRVPDRSARILLKVIEKHPEAVEDAIRAA
jgi:putative transcriptional regulator